MSVFEADPELVTKIEEAQQRVDLLIDTVERLRAEVRGIKNALNLAWSDYTAELDQAEREPKKGRGKLKVKPKK